MKTIDLETDPLDLREVIRLAGEEPLLLLSGGQEFVVAQADDFEAEVASLRSSESFNAFLDERSKSKRRIKLEDMERRVDARLAGEAP
jgi:hypothetical protein